MSDDVKEIQARLAELGYDPGPADGLGGPRTTAATKSFQTSKNLVADGRIGPLTLRALFPERYAQTGALITAEVIKKVAPDALPVIVQGIAARPDLLFAAGITTPVRAAHFLAQIATESGGLTDLDENLGYTARRLMEVWPKRFPTTASTVGFANNPRALANKVYGDRLGNTESDDGWRYRGGGLIQTTGRDNYRSAGYEDDPDALRSMPGALIAALAYWMKNGLNQLADRNDVTAVRKRVNGGDHGLDKAKMYFKRAARALGV